MEEILKNVVRKKVISSVVINYDDILELPASEGSKGLSTTPKEVMLNLSDFSESAQKEIIEKL
jgi:hypothetical protein